MISGGELRLPEMQRRYVWPATRVRDLLDSLYRLDRQQRLTGLSAILHGEPVTVRGRERPIDILKRFSLIATLN